MQEITAQKNSKINEINNMIAAKNREISEIKASSMTETEKTLRLAALNKQLKYLETKKANTINTYNNKLNALKY
ncbi:hypothetical protein SDC9_208494 [bioreactor metagenome]|uniref:Uncharacterized protein n=1 Tax=bioreactor metagenome TaxID=1076179 RepID=A0A645JC79_9ZZZZ